MSSAARIVCSPIGTIAGAWAPISRPVALSCGSPQRRPHNALDSIPSSSRGSERGVRDLRISTLVKVARGLNVAASEFLRGLR